MPSPGIATQIIFGIWTTNLMMTLFLVGVSLKWVEVRATEILPVGNCDADMIKSLKNGLSPMIFKLFSTSCLITINVVFGVFSPLTHVRIKPQTANWTLYTQELV